MMGLIKGFFTFITIICLVFFILLALEGITMFLLNALLLIGIIIGILSIIGMIYIMILKSKL